eukprot:Hpha_TRINITY_DN16502_c0_g3::TRINITY_DN16502_c0_g3_i1::g.135847::m.135847
MPATPLNPPVRRGSREAWGGEEGDASGVSLGTPLGGTPASGLGSSWGRSDAYPPSNGHGGGGGGFGRGEENFKVVVRVRPPNTREMADGSKFVNIVSVPPDQGGDRTVTITEVLHPDDGTGRGGGVYASQTFTFDRVYDQNASQSDVYNHTGRASVDAVLGGYNATMIAYGQTGTGKTYTMEGFTEEGQRGIIPRATEDIFSHIHNAPESSKFLVRASYLQIYNEVISDLIMSERRNLNIRECRERGVYVSGLSEWVVRSPQEIYGLIEQGDRKRVTGNTRMSELSSRSHAIFRLVCEMQSEEDDEEGELAQVFRHGKLNIVDLAGSEKVRQTGAVGKRLEESKYINRSLSHLGKVIAALAATTPDMRGHVPYRDSKLTRVLEDSLGGNCKTTMVATVSPAQDSYAETLSTLKYANRAKNIRNTATINEDVDPKALIRRYEREIKALRGELAGLNQRYGSVLPKSSRRNSLIQGTPETPLEPGDADGNAANEQSFREAIHKVSEEYMERLDELDKERQVIEEDKAQVDRYKQLLLKQRDIMTALTARLSERDNSILLQQEEIEAYEHQQRLMEDDLDHKTELVLRAQAGRGCPSCCGQSSLAFAGQEGSFVLSELRRRWDGDGCGGEWLRENVKADEGEPRDSDFLGTGDKVHELYSHLLSLRKEMDSQPPNMRQQLLDAQEEQAALHYLLSERAARLAEEEKNDAAMLERFERREWRRADGEAEAQCRVAECAHEVSRVGIGSAEAPLRECVARELAAVRTLSDELAVELRNELGTIEQDCRKAEAEAKRLQAELVSTRRALKLPAEAATTPDVVRVWEVVQSQEQKARKSASSAAPSDPTSSRSVGALESKIEDMQRQHSMARHSIAEETAQMEQQLGRLRAERTGSTDRESGVSEAASLKRALATHGKDRRALRTIMETKIKTKIDNVSRALHGSQDQKQRVLAELIQLQNLIAASIQAM